MATALIRNKRDTTANWNTNNPVLDDGVFAVEETTTGARLLKIGDGVTEWTDLAYVGGEGGGGGGSTALVIENQNGTAMPAEPDLQFTGSGVEVTDDSENTRTVVTIQPPWMAVNALQNGVKGDGEFFYGSMSADSNVLTATTDVFSSEDVGKSVCVSYALSTAWGDGNTLTATIESVTSPTEAVLSVSADTSTGSNSSCMMATDDSATLATLTNLSPLPVFLPGDHIYGFASTCSIGCEVYGAGAQSIVVSMIYEDVFSLSGYNQYDFTPDVQLHDLAICTFLEFYNQINSGAGAYPDLYTKSQFAVSIAGVAGNWDVAIMQYRVYNIHSGFGFSAYTTNPFTATSGNDVNINPCFQGLCIGTSPQAYAISGSPGYIGGVQIDNWSIVTQGGHCVWVCGGADQWHGDTHIGSNVWLYNVGNLYADGTNYFYDPLCQIVSCDNCTLDNILQTSDAASGHGLVIGGANKYITNIGKVTVHNCFFNDVLVVLDIGLASEYPDNQYPSLIGEVIIDNTSSQFEEVEPDASFEYDQSLAVIAKNLATGDTGGKHVLDVVKIRDLSVYGQVDIDLDPSVVECSSEGGEAGSSPEIVLNGVTVKLGVGSLSALTNQGKINIHANTDRFRIMNCDVLSGIVVAAGTSNEYIIAYNDTHGVGVTDGGTGSTKIVGNNI